MFRGGKWVGLTYTFFHISPLFSSGKPSRVLVKPSLAPTGASPARRFLPPRAGRLPLSPEALPARSPGAAAAAFALQLAEADLGAAQEFVEAEQRAVEHGQLQHGVESRPAGPG